MRVCPGGTEIVPALLPLDAGSVLYPVWSEPPLDPGFEPFPSGSVGVSEQPP